jgi:hypothetical protein
MKGRSSARQAFNGGTWNALSPGKGQSRNSISSFASRKALAKSMAFRPHTASVFEVPQRVLPLERVFSDLNSLDGCHVWVLGILHAEEGEWQLQESAQRLDLDVGPEVAAALLEPLWVNEGRRCVAQGALVVRSRRAPFLVVERVVTARSLGILEV